MPIEQLQAEWPDGEVFTTYNEASFNHLLIRHVSLTAALMLVQLIFNTSPLMTALLAEVLLGAPPPPKLLPTLLLTIAGTGGWPVLVKVPPCMACQAQGLKYALSKGLRLCSNNMASFYTTEGLCPWHCMVSDPKP